MINPLIASLGVHPFPRLTALLSYSTPPEGIEIIDVTIGEPRFEPPTALINNVITQHTEQWRGYPSNNGPDWFRNSISHWLESRNNLPVGSISPNAIIPTAGAREALYQLGFVIQPRDGKRLFAMPTPHYAPYRAAAIMSGLEPLYLPATETSDYLPDLDQIAIYGPQIAVMLLCSPSNPEGAIASPSYLRRAVSLAREFNFLLIVDECYSEIYFETKPASVLEICWEMRDEHALKKGADPLRNVVSVNSISKRSSAAGLRVGFVAGDQLVIKGLVDLRSYCGGTTPQPNLGVAAALWQDESHVDDIRAQYRQNFEIAQEVLGHLPGFRCPKAGMFLWLRVDNDEAAALHAWQHGGLRVVPGSYIGTPGYDGQNPASTHIRIAMVHPPEIIRSALLRLIPTLEAHGPKQRELA
ncbi:aminotransferase class I/II-fold pyridoxal phosphate-dependent enzyme [Aeromonas dhakensis]|uniref:aminotransferase class I/II-fold pyridoxal phosphate-dependent enzyme n=1 Tax=Aeromonas dhakensis TaxID=196024 RepID=UPI0021B20154|nr:aminotransferase class I/II-fold pyridoxal phosphate-dependent enzyme [Aeromonas dhakensis]UXB10081.1 aminotransferase class I/II-fold pyridoxal phosphate-dependent enzyme [Aeromonas dhakensis]